MPPGGRVGCCPLYAPGWAVAVLMVAVIAWQRRLRIRPPVMPGAPR